jgi:imidazolonepropionase-like amidohydrolase
MGRPTYVADVSGGTPPLEAIRAATANRAELLRLPDVGTIEPGKRADLLLVDGDPVDDPWTLLGRRRTQAGVPV